MEVKPLTISDLEKKDEEQLYTNISELNNYIITNKDSSTTMIPSLSNLSICSDSFSPISTNTTQSDSDEINKNEISKFYFQNLISYDDKAKLVFIGKPNSGKDLILESFLHNKEKELRAYKSCLDIHKTNVKLNNNRNISLEIISATNNEMLNKNMLITYYKIAHGCVIVSNNIQEDKEFIIEQIEMMNTISSDYNIIFILNSEKEDMKVEIGKILENYYVSYFVHENLEKGKEEVKTEFKRFLEEVLIKKNLNICNKKRGNKNKTF